MESMMRKKRKMEDNKKWFVMDKRMRQREKYNLRQQIQSNEIKKKKKLSNVTE